MMFSGSTVTNHPPSTHERLNALAHYYAAAASAFHEIFYHKFTKKFFAELFRKSAVIFPEISGKIPQEISGNFRTHNPTCDICIECVKIPANRYRHF